MINDTLNPLDYIFHLRSLDPVNSLEPFDLPLTSLLLPLDLRDLHLDLVDLSSHPLDDLLPPAYALSALLSLLIANAFRHALHKALDSLHDSPGPASLITRAHLDVDLRVFNQDRERESHLACEFVEGLSEHVQTRQHFVVQQAKGHLRRFRVETEVQRRLTLEGTDQGVQGF